MTYKSDSESDLGEKDENFYSKFNYLEEILHLRTSLHECEMERDQLKNKLDASRKLIKQMEMELLYTELATSDGIPTQLDTMKTLQTLQTFQALGKTNRDSSSSTSMSSWSDGSSFEALEPLDPLEHVPNKIEKKRKINKEVLDRWLYYTQHKDDINVLKPLHEKFNKIGIDKVPWMFVKKKTDELFKAHKASQLVLPHGCNV